MSETYNLDACTGLILATTSSQTELHFIRFLAFNQASKCVLNIDQNEISSSLEQINILTNADFGTIRNFTLNQSILDGVYKEYEKAANNTSPKLIASLNILLAHQYYSEERLTNLIARLDDLVQSDINNASFFLNSIIKNEKFYQSTVPDDISLFLKKLFEKIKNTLINYDFNSNNIFILIKLINMLQKLYKLSNKDCFLPLTAREFHKLTENLKQNVELDSEQNSSKPGNFLLNDEKLVGRYYALKSVALILTLTDKNINDKLIISFADVVTNLIDNILKNKIDINLDGNKTLMPIQMIDMLTLFGIFNVYDIDNFTKDFGKIEKLKIVKKQLDALNSSGFHLLQKNKVELDTCTLIMYNMSLINLSIENKEVIFHLFTKVNSIDGLRKLCENQSEVSKSNHILI